MVKVMAAVGLRIELVIQERVVGHQIQPVGPPSRTTQAQERHSEKSTIPMRTYAREHMLLAETLHPKCQAQGPTPAIETCPSRRGASAS